MKKDSFFEKVYDVVRQIPKGKVTTYGRIAAYLGKPNGARAVGWALHVNPYDGEVPCHRVVNREGRLSDAFCFGGREEHKRRLYEEDILFLENGNVNILNHLWQPI